MAESLLLPLVRAAASKAGDVLVQRVSRMWGIDDDRRRLERQLVAIQRKLIDAETKSETDPSIKIWMKHLRAVAYEADDILDDFQYEGLSREAQIGDSKARKVLCYFTNRSPLLFRLIMGRKLNNVLEKINELVTEMTTFGLENRAEAPPAVYKQTHSALDYSTEIFGRDNEKEEVVKLLLAQKEEHKVQVLPVFGMGGMGKTTFAKMMYNDPRIQHHFQLKLWHCVSEKFDVVAILKSIIELATNKRQDLSDTIEMLRRRLEEEIGRKRFLLVLDDVWNEDEKKWYDDLKPLLCSVGGPGSIIMVTCRSQRIASIMATLQPHELACLSEEDSWKLFSSKAFSHGVEAQEELVTIGRRIAKKCRGLPLALKTIGGLMSSKQQVHEWEIIDKSNIGDNYGGKSEILPILKLSYIHLSSEMKQCFALCAIFPKDYEMDKDILIQLWIANGCFQEEETMNLMQKGEYIFNVLVWRSFLQDVKENELGLSVGCKMHDFMHDLAKHVTNECATIQELIQKKASLEDTRHLFIGEEFDELEQNNRVLRGTICLRTLFPPSRSKMNLMEIKLMSLRALCCEPASIINRQVINAKHLRYLDFSESYITNLSDSICMLYNLQTLRLNNCGMLKRLPEGLTTMRKLIHLYLFGCYSLEKMPPNISLLNNLCTLTTFVVSTESGRGIEELKFLSHLSNRLELFNLRKIKSVQNSKEANLQQKQNIIELLLCWGSKESEEPEDEASNHEEVLASLKTHSKLRSLEVYGYGGLESSQWMRDAQMFQCLRKLIISNCPRCNDLPIVWLSGSLEYLYVKRMFSLTTLCMTTVVEKEEQSTHLHFFPKLKELVLDELPILERWVENFGGQPNSLLVFECLQVLHIGSCPKLPNVPQSPVLKTLNIWSNSSIPICSLSHLTTLSQLKYIATCYVSTSMPICSWTFLERFEIKSLANMMMSLEDQQRQIRPLEKLRDLYLQGPNCFATIPGLSKSYLLLWECFVWVEKLNIFGCHELVHWPWEELSRLVHLRSLSIGDCENLGQGSSSGEIPKLLGTLERLYIQKCKSIMALPLNLLDLANLRILNVSGCNNLRALVDGDMMLSMDGLPSLEILRIVNCPLISELPQGLLQRLPALKSLRIPGCSPDLERRCRAGGEYFHLVSSIPRLYIGEPETGSSMKKKKSGVRMLLPSCGGSS